MNIKGYTNTLEGFDSPILAHPREFFFSKSEENHAFFRGLPFLTIYDTIKTLLTLNRKGLYDNNI